MTDEDGWKALSDESQRKIYADLDEITGRVSDHTIHPLRHPIYGPHLKAYINNIERHIANGANKAWENEAKQASTLRARETMSAPPGAQGLNSEDFFAEKVNNMNTDGGEADGDGDDERSADENIEDGGKVAYGRAASADI